MILLLFNLNKKIIVAYRAEISCLKSCLKYSILKDRKIVYIFVDKYRYFSMSRFMKFSLFNSTIGVVLYLSI